MSFNIQFPHSTGFKISFGQSLMCPKCNSLMMLLHVVMDNWPYTHCDLALKCSLCGFEALFGVPINPLFGMELIVWDTEPETVIQQASKLPVPTCPFHGKPMRLTKVWGDKVMQDPGEIRAQWKCPEWFLTVHKTVKREVLSRHAVEQQERVRRRLEQLGYLNESKSEK